LGVYGGGVAVKLKTVVVLGGRSGSSAVAHILKTLGVYMGATFLSRLDGHKFYENVDFVKINNTIRNSPLRDHLDPEVMWETSKENEKLIEETLAKHTRKPIWGFKEPNTAPLLPIYKKFLKNPHYIICDRDVNEVAKSMRGVKKLQVLQAMWLEIATRRRDVMYEMTEGFPRLIIHFNNLFDDVGGVVDDIVKFLGIKPTEAQKKLAIKVVDRDKRHYG
jgi:hypothetical protein